MALDGGLQLVASETMNEYIKLELLLVVRVDGGVVVIDDAANGGPAAAPAEDESVLLLLLFVSLDAAAQLRGQGGAQ
jgi:hypothetical protein